MDLIWKGNRILVPGGNLHIGWAQPAPIPDKFYAVSSAGVTFATVPTITGVQTYKANLFLDSTSSTFENIFQTVGVNDFLSVQISPSFDSGDFSLYVQVKQGQFTKVRYYYNIPNYVNQKLSLEIVKGTGSITSVKINGNTLTKDGDSGLEYGDGTYKRLNANHGVSVWNVEIVGRHKWVGYPYGNLSSAWVDIISSDHGTITGTPTTRVIS